MAYSHREIEKAASQLLGAMEKDAIMASRLLPKAAPGMKALRNLVAKWYWGMGRAGTKRPYLPPMLAGAGATSLLAGLLSSPEERLRNSLIGLAMGGAFGGALGPSLIRSGATQAAAHKIRRAVIKNFEFAPLGAILTPTPIPAGLILPMYVGAKRGVKTMVLKRLMADQALNKLMANRKLVKVLKEHGVKGLREAGVGWIRSQRARMLQKLMSDPTLVHALKQRGADIPRGLKAITPRFRKAYRSMETGFKDLGERMRHERLKAWKALLGSLGIGGGVYAMSRPSGRTHGNQVWIGGEDAS